MNFKSIDEVVAWRACVGCGACSYLSGGKGIRMRNIPEVGHNPHFPALRSDLLALSGASRRKQSPSSQNFRAALRNAIAQTVTTEEEIEDEIRHLFEVFQSD